MARSAKFVARAMLIVLALAMALFQLGCRVAPSGRPLVKGPETASPAVIHGRVVFDREAPRLAQATMASVVQSSTVTLADTAGFAFASAVTDASGNFTLAPANFVPAAGAIYILEAGKSLSAGAPGQAMARFRTLLEWNGSGWLSITNGAVGGAVVLDPLTTAVALEQALYPTQVTGAATIGRVDASVTPAVLTGSAFAGHPDAEINTLAGAIVTDLAADLDPVESVSGVVPAIASASTTAAPPGSLVSLAGTGFQPSLTANTVKFGTVTAPVYVAAPELLIVGVPAGAGTGAITVTTSLGTSVGLGFNASAVSVTIDPSGYPGSWGIPGAVAGWQNGKHSLDFSPGIPYTLQINGGSSYTFSVSAAGAVTANGGPFTGGVQSLTFNTASVTLDMAGVSLVWGIDYLRSSQVGNQTVNLLKSSAYTLRLEGTSSSIPFSVDGAGAVTVTGGSATGGAGTLTLNTATVTVAPNGFPGVWQITGLPNQFVGQQSQAVVVGQTYSLTLAGLPALVFAVDAAGAVSTTDARATTSVSTLSLKTFPIAVNVSGWRGTWIVSGVMPSAVTGNQTVNLVASSAYAIAPNGTSTALPFSIDAAGLVTSNSASATGGSKVLAFAVQNVTVSTGGYAATWSITGAGTQTNYLDGKVPLIKAQSYAFYPNSGNTQNVINFTVDSSGTVISYSSSATGGAGTLALSTGSVTVNVNGWAVPWQIEGLAALRGNQTVTLVKGFGYTLYPAPAVPSWRVAFSLDSGGNVGASFPGSAVGTTLSIATVTESITTAAGNRWLVANADGVWRFGNDSVVLIKGFTYTLSQYASPLNYSQAFAITAGGNASPASLNPSGSSAYTLSP